MTPKQTAAQVALIKQTVAGAVGVSPAQIDGESREADTVKARHLSMLFCRRLLGMSYPAIAEAFNKPTHVTALLACRAMETKIATNKKTALFSESLEGVIRAKLSVTRK